MPLVGHDGKYTTRFCCVSGLRLEMEREVGASGALPGSSPGRGFRVLALGRVGRF